MLELLIFGPIILVFAGFAVWHFRKQGKRTDQQKALLDGLCQAFDGKMLKFAMKGYGFELDHQGRRFEIAYGTSDSVPVKILDRLKAGVIDDLTIRTDVPRYYEDANWPINIVFRFDSGFERRLGRKSKSGDPIFDRQVWMWAAAYPKPDKLIEELTSKPIIRQSILEISRNRACAVNLNFWPLGGGSHVLSAIIGLPKSEDYDPALMRRLMDLLNTIAQALPRY